MLPHTWAVDTVLKDSWDASTTEIGKSVLSLLVRRPDADCNHPVCWHTPCSRIILCLTSEALRTCADPITGRNHSRS